jgi:PncC family amidohydrolase
MPEESADKAAGVVPTDLKLEMRIGEKLRALGLTIATAESCTGGLIGHRLTNLAGSSEYFWGGVISYDNRVKHGVLGVPMEVLDTVGAVSQECALAMAHGVCRLMGTNLGVSSTGIAGPGGGTVDKPVGLVYIALVDDQGFERCECYVWPGDRLQNKASSSQAALHIVLNYLEQRFVLG